MVVLCCRGMRKDERYTFTILNFEKPKSLFQNGMQPLVYSERRAAEPGGVGWARGGREISYRPGRPRPKPRADEAADKTKDGKTEVSQVTNQHEAKLEIAASIKMQRDGTTPYLSVCFSPPYEKPSEPEPASDDLDDDIPF